MNRTTTSSAPSVPATVVIDAGTARPEESLSMLCSLGGMERGLDGDPYAGCRARVVERESVFTVRKVVTVDCGSFGVLKVATSGTMVPSRRGE